MRLVALSDLPLQLAYPASRLGEAADFRLYLMRQVGKLAQYTANRLRRRRRGKQMAFAWAWMGGANPVRAKTHHPRPTERRTESVELTLVQITQLEPVSLREAKRVSRSRLVGIQPSAPND